MGRRPIRSGFQSVVPYLSVRDASDLVAFLVAAFDAEETYRSPTGTHFEVRIGDSMVMIGDVGDRRPRTGQLFMYVEDADASFGAAVRAGARPILEPGERPWGEGDGTVRAAAVEDAWGNRWFLAGPVGRSPSPTPP